MILAIDPGIHGALALYDPDLDWLFTMRLPTQWRLVNKKKKTELDLIALRDFIVHRKDITDVIVEQATAMTGAGATSQFNFGRTVGQCEAIIVGIGLPVTTVHPIKWKTALDVPSDKNRSRARAQVLFPGFAHQFKTMASEGEGEAAMLAFYRHMVKTRAAVPELKKVSTKAMLAAAYPTGKEIMAGLTTKTPKAAPVTGKRGPGRPRKIAA